MAFQNLLWLACPEIGYGMADIALLIIAMRNHFVDVLSGSDTQVNGSILSCISYRSM